MEALHFKEAEFMELFQVLHHLHFSILIFLGGKVAALISGAESNNSTQSIPGLN